MKEKFTTALKSIHNTHNTGMVFQNHTVLKDSIANEYLLLPPKWFTKKEIKNLLVCYINNAVVFFSMGLQKGVYIDRSNMYYKATMSNLIDLSSEVSK